MLVSEDNVEATSSAELFTCVAVPFVAAVAALASVEVSMPANPLRAFTTVLALELFTRFAEPSMSPVMKSPVKVLVASATALAPVSIFPMLTRVVRSERSRVPVALRIL